MQSDEITQTFKKNRYISFIFEYGMVPVIFLLEHYIQEEKYEECIPIKDAVNDINTYDSGGLCFDINKMKDEFSLYGYKGERHMERLLKDLHTIKDYIEEVKF